MSNFWLNLCDLEDVAIELIKHLKGKIFPDKESVFLDVLVFLKAQNKDHYFGRFHLDLSFSKNNYWVTGVGIIR